MLLGLFELFLTSKFFFIDKFKNLHLVVNLPDGRCIHVPLTYQEYEKLDHSGLFEYLPKGRII